MKILFGKQVLIHASHHAINHIAGSQTVGKVIGWKKPSLFLTELQQFGVQGRVLHGTPPLAESP